ncbi:MAG: hypothetical protein ACFFED_11265 [Candidatus Thorarchaeota archaeon]
MEESIRVSSIERAKVYGMIYSILNIFNVILFFSTSLLMIATPDQRLRAFTLMWLSALLIAVVAVEMLRSLYSAGANPLALSIIGAINIIFVGMQLAVYADIMVYDIMDTPMVLLIVYLILATVGVLVLILWMVMMYIKHRKQATST